MKTEKLNLKSDVSAKEAFKIFLENKGIYDSVKISSSPADIIAQKGTLKHYFEIKYTKQKKKYFGAATLTEWISAMKNPGCFWFVIAIENFDRWQFIEYTPQEFMGFNTIPPFKTYFNIDIDQGKVCSQKKETKSIQLTIKRLNEMEKVFKNFSKK